MNVLNVVTGSRTFGRCTFGVSFDTDSEETTPLGLLLRFYSHSLLTAVRSPALIITVHRNINAKKELQSPAVTTCNICFRKPAEGTMSLLNLSLLNRFWSAC